VDPLLLEVLRFGVAILAGGIVAVVSAVLTYRYAERLRDSERQERKVALLRALRAEIEENIVRIGPVDGVEIPGPTVRTAWDEARTLPLVDQVFAVVASAYREGALLNDALALFNSQFVTSSLMPNDQLVVARTSDVGKRAHERAKRAKAAFENARDALNGT
jgi:hypothetical protein